MARALVAFIGLLISAGLFGCSGEPERSGSVDNSPRKPWAELLKSAYDNAGSDAERRALEDGVISDQEYAYFQDHIVSCLARIGITARWSSDKSLDYDNPAGVRNDAINTCNKENGLDVIALRDSIDRNPQQLDENEILVACLKRVRAVDSGYTASMLARGVGLDRFIDTEAFNRCNADPLRYGKTT